MKKLVLVFVTLLFSGLLPAAPLIEDFENPFPLWKTRWLATNSNLMNYYEEVSGCYGIDCRGNNPDGLWIGDGIPGGASSYITFSPAFAATITSFAIDIASYVSSTLEVVDKDGTILLSVLITNTNGAFTDPGVYSHYAVASGNGIGGFRILGGSVEGNVSIDNVEVNGDLEPPPGVPEPSTFALMGLGVAALLLRRRS
jgi:hypothetical protein